ncbi:tRNA-binding protein [Candidatus Saccharibacteria bacterium]|nr:tRNA-binding protein [Candidatus Saccharibacteria bacterium]
MLTLEEFDKVEMRVGTIVAVKINKRARVPAYGLKIDLGEFGVKSSSAQITDLYSADELVGKQVVVVTNFAPIRIADVKSEVRVLGADSEKGCVLLEPEREVTNGSRIF